MGTQYIGDDKIEQMIVIAISNRYLGVSKELQTHKKRREHRVSSL